MCWDLLWVKCPLWIWCGVVCSLMFSSPCSFHKICAEKKITKQKLLSVGVEQCKHCFFTHEHRRDQRRKCEFTQLFPFIEIPPIFHPVVWSALPSFSPVLCHNSCLHIHLYSERERERERRVLILSSRPQPQESFLRYKKLHEKLNEAFLFSSSFPVVEHIIDYGNGVLILYRKVIFLTEQASEVFSQQLCLCRAKNLNS